jgi:hypothetical protein
LASLIFSNEPIMRSLIVLHRLLVLPLFIPAVVHAQMPGVPVLQNAWATPGIVVALNAGGGSKGSVWGGALSWAPGSGERARLQFSGGGGMQSVSGSGSRGVYGVRLAAPLMQMMDGKLGVAAFGGVGGGGSGGSTDTTATKSLVPVGVAIGYRQALGSRGFSVYGTPSFQRASGKAGSASAIRVAFGIDFALAKNIGLTGGIELGQTASTGEVGPRGSIYGVGASYALGRR